MNTMKTTVLGWMMLILPMLAWGQATDIFFSEYIEGGSNRKALEIYNGTGGPVSLDNYRIAQSSNGNGWQYYHYFPVGTVMPHNTVWVMITDQIDSSFFNNSLANQILAFPDLVYFNGNDARAIEKTTDGGTTWIPIDIFGNPNSSTNFNVAGITGAAVNKTLVRKASVCAPNANWALSAGTDTASSEWLVYPQDVFTYLGNHTANCQSTSIPGIVINEFLADNVTAYQDPSDNSYDDWIELYNPTSQPVNLFNWSITDNRNNPLKWVFPDTTITAGGYLIVWADQDIADPGLHAAFALSKGGEEIFLYHSTGVRVDSIIFGPQKTDTSYSRLPNGSGPFSFAPPTPMAANMDYPPVLIDTIPPVPMMAWATSPLNVHVTFSEAVGLSAEVPGNYTGLPAIASVTRSAGLDSVHIVLASPLLTGVPYTLSISAIADTAGNIMPVSKQFTVGFGSLNHAIVITEIMYNPPESGTDTTEFIEIYNNGQNAVELGGFTFSKGVDYTFPSMQILPGQYKVVAYSAQAMSNTFGVSALQWTSGALSNSGEEIEIKDALGNVVDYVNFDDVAPWPVSPDGFGPSLTLCDPSTDNSLAVNWTASTEFAAINAAGDTLFATPGAGCFIPIPLTADFTGTPLNILTGDTVVFTDLSLGNPTSWIWSFPGGTPATSNLQHPQGIVYNTPGMFDVTLIVQNTAGEHDTLVKTNYIKVDPAWYPDVVITEIMYNPPESGTDTLEFIELYNNDNQAVNLQGWKFSKGVDLTFPAITLQPGDYLVVAAFPNAVSQFFGVPAIGWTSGGLSNSGEEIELKDAFGYVIDYVNFDDVSPWPVSPDGYGPSLSLCNPALDNSLGSNWTASTWYAGVNGNGDSLFATPGYPCVPPILPVAAFTASQTQIIASGSVNFTDLSTYNPHSWTWSFPGGTPAGSTDKNPSGIVYAWPGLYDVSLIVTNPTGSDTLTLPNYIQVLPPPVPAIVITEIMYNPPESGTDTLEFLELYNNDVLTVDLAGYYFSKGITYTFPSIILAPGQYLLLAVDSSAFQSFYNKPARQWTAGALSNSGEEIELKDKYGSVVDYVNFDDAAPWPVSPDGFGPSLTLCDRSADNSLAINWTASTELVGYVDTIAVYASPGAGCTFVYNVNGHVHYATPAGFAFQGAQVVLSGQGGLTKTTTTDPGGYYHFGSILDGSYNLTASTSLPWGSVNANDALLVLKHFIGAQILNGMQAAASDVNADGTVNAADAMFVLKRFVGMSTSFQAGDWLFENPAILVNGMDVTKNVLGICMGDVDASYGNVKSAGGAIDLNSMQVREGEGISIPVSLSEPVRFGAVSLTMNWPSGLELVSVSGPDGLMQYALTGNELRLAWVNPEGVRIAKEAMFNIHARVLSIPDNGMNLADHVSFVEISDLDARVLPYVKLSIPSLQSGDASLRLYPNPAHTQLQIALPEGLRDAELTITDMTGRVWIRTDYENIRSRMNLDVSSLQPAAYILTVRSGNTRYAERLVIMR